MTYHWLNPWLKLRGDVLMHSQPLTCDSLETAEGLSWSEAHCPPAEHWTIRAYRLVMMVSWYWAACVSMMLHLGYSIIIVNRDLILMVVLVLVRWFWDQLSLLVGWWMLIAVGRGWSMMLDDHWFWSAGDGYHYLLSCTLTWQFIHNVKHDSWWFVTVNWGVQEWLIDGR